ncbi:peptidoglycan-binding domain-containing protein [Marivita hallyeonensis]|uniref:Putative peptidoglycan binding domain-containing protein n=1 Tax=Marivita hallyeonensis TaxID=996342 RepID=A0A1M5M7E2_9RHOB|nr:peptidoglycan-binding protein [Marivita hallyeonensis]SHG72849.1 Putative peptidoglycan binding domain-containing protein [Marivita hallyeonensis]
MKRLVLSLSATMAFAAPAVADNSDVLIIGNSDQSVLQRLTGSGDLTATQSRFAARGTEISIALNADRDGMRTAFLEFAENLDATTDDVAVALTGRFVSTVSGSYLLPADMGDDVSLAQVVAEGLPVDALYAVMAEYPGRALLVLGEVEIDETLPSGLSANLPLRDVSQGVTVAVGPAGDVVRFIGRLAEWPGGDVLPLAREAGLSLAGFVPLELPLLAETEVALPQVVETEATSDRAAEDDAAWQEALTADREAGYETYLAAFPNGLHAAEARQRLTAIRAEPFYQEKQAEADLGLSRNARREIQRDLSLLGYNTRGIDGIFGRGTRGAVTAWQNQNGLPASGYLSADQITRLDAQAERRAAELEEEARQRQAELERQDRAFWEETGARGDEPGYRAYLRRFPDGQFAEVAEERLAAIEAQRRAQAEDQDRLRWQQIREIDTQDAYRAYLAERPNGAFAEEAKERIAWLDRNSEQREIQARGQAEEAALGLNAAARRLAEARLAELGLEPGVVDGEFDDDARRAIRRYQDARDLRVSGYLDQATVVRLMADTILR